MNWTKEQPTKPGFYWCYDHGVTFVEEVLIDNAGRLFIVSTYDPDLDEDRVSRDYDLEFVAEFWMGPLQPPEPPKDAK